MAEPQPNAEITDKSAADQQQRKPSPDPKPVDDQQSQQQQNQTNRDAARNGDVESNKGSDLPAQAQSEQLQSPTHSGSARKSVRWSPELVTESRDLNNNDGNSNSGRNNIYLDGSNPYVSKSPAQPSSPSFSIKETMGTVKDVLGRWGKRVGEATRKAEDLSRNTWQHLKTSPSFADAALGRIAQGTKVLAEGGYEKIFRQTFETVSEEQLLNSFACYLSTSAGPVMGVLYVSTAKLAFCSDNPLSYESNGQTEWSYYKVVIPLHQLKAVNPSSSRTNPAEKYIQVISVDNHEFWYMGFLNYNGAAQSLQDALLARDSQTV